MSGSKPSGLTIAIVTGVLTILGAASGSILKSYSDIRLERTKLDSQLILNALKSDSLKERRNTLLFLVDAKLIANKETADGLKLYFEGSNPKPPPQIRPFISSGESVPLARDGENIAHKTDIDIFVCDKDNTNDKVRKMINAINNALNKSTNYGTGNLKIWDGDLYKEIPLSELKGKTTIIMDFNHGEYGERAGISSILDSVFQLPERSFVQNKGKETPWRISVVVCLK